jgi:hypothetical protein
MFLTVYWLIELAFLLPVVTSKCVRARTSLNIYYKTIYKKVRRYCYRSLA